MTQSETAPQVKTATPEVGSGFLAAPADPLRYDGHTYHRYEVVGRLCSLVPAGARVLDVGCGTGSVSRLVAERSKGDFLGIEPNPERAETARQRGLKVLNGYLTPEVFQEHGKFDVVMFADVLEHLPDPAAIIRIAKAGLNPGGCIIASVPNIAHWTVRFGLFFGRFRYEPTGIMDATHLRWFTRRTLKDFIASEGFCCEEALPTAGVTMNVYNHYPCRIFPRRVRNPIIRAFTLMMPKLMACQFVVKAVKSN